MKDEYVGNNYKLAKEEADKVDQQIIDVLLSGRSFRVEAGAGSGKTYSLNKVIEWIQTNKKAEYIRRKQKVVCITYTNAAVDVIAERLPNKSFVLPSTIHSFAWNAIKQYQSFLIKQVKTDKKFSLTSEQHQLKEVSYTLGSRYFENGIQYLHHDDVLKFFCNLLDNDKFRLLFADRYPLILIDEYQDSHKPIIDRFIQYFIDKKIGPQFAFFGDAWQTIYQSHACGLIEHANIEVIMKGSNFRSAPRIVQLLNDLRPALPQKSAIDDFNGEVVAITCDDYLGDRRTDKFFKDDLPIEELRKRVDAVKAKVEKVSGEQDTLKVLMITHRVLAAQQGYEKLLEILNDRLKDQEDPFLLFFMKVVEPVYRALMDSDMKLLFDSLGIQRYPISKKSEKTKWRDFQKKLEIARREKAIDVIKLIHQTKLVPVPPQLEKYYYQYENEPNSIYVLGTTIRSFLDLNYQQFISAIDFLYPNASFSTEHGVKGEEYDNVIFVISRGWSQYKFETYAPMITGQIAIPLSKQSSFEKNRNLFYVCCSRPRKRLFFLVTIPTDPTFRHFLEKLVGRENVISYNHFVDQK